MERTCKKCGETKHIDDFVKNKFCKLGVSHICRKCENERQTKRRDKDRITYNKRALESNYKRHPYLIERKKLIDMGMKKCSRCGKPFDFMEFNKGGCICYKCRTGHERGAFINKKDNGQYIKILTNEERKLHQKEYTKKWNKNNQEKRRLIDKRANTKRILSGKVAEYARMYYHLNPNRESRLRYQKSMKGLIASRKAKIKWRKANPGNEKTRARRHITNLNGCYVIAKLKRSTGLPAQTLRQHPELIELKRTQLQLLRLTKKEEA